MKQYFPRCDLPRRKKKKDSQFALVMPPPRYTTPCTRCGEASYYCVHDRGRGTYVCENCYRKEHVVLITKQKQWLWDHKAATGCVACDEKDPRCLDYHHLNPKKKKFSIGSVHSSIPDDTYRIEMKKCVVICANCHRKVEIAIQASF